MLKPMRVCFMHVSYAYENTNVFGVSIMQELKLLFAGIASHIGVYGH